MSVLTNAQVAALQRVLATCNQVLPRIEMLEALANVNPDMRQRVTELRAQREYLVQLATTALEIDRQIVPGAMPSGSWSQPEPQPRAGSSPPAASVSSDPNRSYRIAYGAVLFPGDTVDKNGSGKRLFYDNAAGVYYFYGNSDEYNRSAKMDG